MNRYDGTRAMVDKFQDVTDAELAILQVLWDKGPVDVRGLVAQLYPSAKPSDVGTVQKLLVRLESKGCIRRDRSAWRHRFEATIERADLIGHRVRELAEKMCGGSVTPLLTHFAHARHLSATEIAELRQFLDDLATQQRRDRNQGDRPRKKRRL